MNCFQISVFDLKLPKKTQQKATTLSFCLVLCATDVAYEAHRCVYLFGALPQQPSKIPRRLRQRRCRVRRGDLSASGEPKRPVTTSWLKLWWSQRNTEKYLRGGFNIYFQKNTSQIRDTIQFWTISICCWKGGGSITNMHQFMSGWTHIYHPS